MKHLHDLAHYMSDKALALDLLGALASNAVVWVWNSNIFFIISRKSATCPSMDEILSSTISERQNGIELQIHGSVTHESVIEHSISSAKQEQDSKSESYLKSIIWASVKEFCNWSSGHSKRKKEQANTKTTFVKIPTPHSIATLAKNKSSANSRSLKPPNCSSQRKIEDFSKSAKRYTISPGILPASIAAARSEGMLSIERPISASARIASVRFFPLDPSSSPLSPPPPPPPPELPDPKPPSPLPEPMRKGFGWDGGGRSAGEEERKREKY
ncbi:hypothetical protein M5K25_002428 [Dendrobium thyrsiflorum]|uniref:Uncharacterized protein n=1 Tax=Dendrobium thyrsiflorum TaxID=117978 RepID=A0ABD0VTY5_DENTH